jgi:hypothetical protein
MGFSLVFCLGSVSGLRHSTGREVELLAKNATVRPAELTYKGFRVWQTLSRRKRGGRREFRVWHTLSRRKQDGSNTHA